MSVVDEDALRALLEEVVEKTVKKVLRGAPAEAGGGDKWVKTAELARNHSLAQSTIRQWIRAGKVEAKLIGGAMRVSLASFQGFISVPRGDQHKGLSPEPPVPTSRETVPSGNVSADGRRMDPRPCPRHPQSQFVKSCPRPTDASRRSAPVALR